MSTADSCCQIPPVVAKGYEPKGKYTEVSGIKSYVTGPAGATKGILVFYDVFGYYPQTLQGADILSNAANSDDPHKYTVVLPDWFEGEPAVLENYPPDTPAKQKAMGEFFEKKAPPPIHLKKLPGIMDALKKDYPDVTAWGVLGYCWGGKMATVASFKDTPFKAAAECHPAMVDAADGAKLTVPICVLASGDEDATVIKNLEAEIKKNSNSAVSSKSHVETFGDQIHGWMAARSNLEDPRVKEEYIRGYTTVLKFFNSNL